MGCAHSSSFTSLRLPPDARGSTNVVRVAERHSVAWSGRWGVPRSEV